MVDFKKLREESKQSNIINPIDIFRRLPKPVGINDLYTSQAEVLNTWFARRNENDIVIKLHTGGGKTLVGLLIAQSVINETKEPVLYLCPTNQLVSQTINLSNQYGISCIPYNTGEYGLPHEFLSAKGVLVATYKALFNGRSKFGISDQNREKISLGAIIFDDAHVSNSIIRDSFSLTITKEDFNSEYNQIVELFRTSFTNLGKSGLFNDTINGIERYSVLEVPFSTWKTYSHNVFEILRKNADNDFPFIWPLIRDDFDYCHALLSNKSIVITPYFPLVDKFPSFSNCAKRIYMSATIADDSSIVRTFDASMENISKPITSNSLAGVGERMILIPEWMNLLQDSREIIETIITWATKDLEKSTIILTPSDYYADSWKDSGKVAKGPKAVDEAVKNICTNNDVGPNIFSNRYDGMDFSGDTCRLLILSNMPRGTNEYENYLANIFEGSILQISLAQIIEQGIGRGVRGSGDHCVVMLHGRDITTWLSQTKNTNFLTKIAKAQLDIGQTVSKEVSNIIDLKNTILKCFNRDTDWIMYHAETLADQILNEDLSLLQLNIANIERKAFTLWKDNHHAKAINLLRKYCLDTKSLENDIQGWLYQFAARIAEYNDDHKLSQDLQQNAYANNKNLFRPEKPIKYMRMSIPSDQSKEITNQLNQLYNKKGAISKLEELTSQLVPESSSNIFEESMKELGKLLGFASERPEKAYRIGPDILWVLNDHQGIIMEAKSRKKNKNAFRKEDHGQLLNSETWFCTEYPDYECIRISIFPNRKKTDSFEIGSTKVLTYDKLNLLLANCNSLYQSLCESELTDYDFQAFCEKELKRLSLTPTCVIDNYLEDFL